MSLLSIDQNPEFRSLANEILNRQLELDPQLGRELDEMAKKRMYQDVVYNLDSYTPLWRLRMGKFLNITPGGFTS